jgi:hypothetical protein
MSEDKKQEGLEPDELEKQEGEELPDREVMSVLDIGDGGLGPPEFGPPELSDPNQ